ncbi:MAG: zf-TFIIB domain-containing protein, partial [Pyrinomonadaceae bacterium]
MITLSDEENMNCPVCTSSELAPTDLDTNLSSLRCAECNGHWVQGSAYWRWLEKNGPNLPEREGPAEGADGPAAESPEPKKCPECRSLMFKYRVGRGLNFSLDQCAGCKGIWFDRREWEILKERNLHDDINAMFTAPWQAQVTREEMKRRLE